MCAWLLCESRAALVAVRLEDRVQSAVSQLSLLTGDADTSELHPAILVLVLLFVGLVGACVHVWTAQCQPCFCRCCLLHSSAVNNSNPGRFPV